MTWFRVDDSFYDHPKVLEAGMPAIGLWTLAGAYCARHLTDGVITDRQIRSIGGTRKQAAKLVEVGLWTCDDAPANARRYFFNDWREYQPSRADVTARRQGDAERKRAARAAKAAEQDKRKNVRPDVQTDGARTSTTMSDDRPLYPTRPDPTHKETRPPVVDVTTDRTPAREVGAEVVELRPPRGGREVAERLNATAHSVEAHTIVREYQRHVGVPIPGDVLSGMARRIDECLAAGVGPEQIARGLVAWRESDSWSPSQIPSFVHKASAKPPRKRGQGKPSAAAEGAVTLAEQMIAEGLTRG
ncbi:hypothetical protein [Nocardia thailandica]